VIAVDTNFLVYAHREDTPFHDAAYRRVTQFPDGPAIWAAPTLHALNGGLIAGAQVHDARVAALCRQNGVRELGRRTETSAGSPGSPC